ncbi:M13 family metallopeptidase [Emticicia sp. BO119]|uniref:M13 family metallopeptidase n=1 Tax=Emticicia sp. BO119 TaxID=2757768 RepID=UPI0015F071CD|nr:M13 family metallopeptidase [Emticicia sp. BO119]MBA4853992.1 M13 family metallopeptidase [Emticicia sp. BO119]
MQALTLPKVLLSGILLVSGISLTSCQSNSSESAQRDILKEVVDTTVSPKDDFFKYAVGNWLKKNPIPASESSWGIGSMVQEETYGRLRTINEESAKQSGNIGSNEQKIGDFWFTGMDSLGIEKQGLSPVKSDLDRIVTIKDLQGVLNEVALQQTYGMGTLFGNYVFQDEKNSEEQALHLYQGGIGLPERDYYFNTDSRNTNIRKEYKAHIQRMFKLLGNDDATATKNMERVYALEETLAKNSRKIEALRDPYKNYNKMDLAALDKLSPSMKFTDLFVRMKMPQVKSAIVGQPEFYTAVDKLLKTTPIDTWKAYLTWNFISNYASELSSQFAKEDFHFYRTILRGVKEMKPRWKRVLDAEERLLGDALGQLFIKNYYSDKTKKRYEELVKNIFSTYKERIEKLDWMSDSTKKKALLKLSTVMPKVSYPDKWKDFSSLDIKKDSYVQNIIRANQWWYLYETNKIGKPVDKTEWGMTPQTYNAYYNPSNNEIVLPAAIFFVAGFTDEQLDDAIIYAYAGGSTIGHEITHGFDDQGRQFDEKGNLTDWWTKKDGEEYNKRAKGIIEQFDNYVVLDSMYVRGEATQGENIADLGGVILGLEAFKKTEQYKSGKKINGFTPLQRYFLGWALAWMGHTRDEALANRIMTDVHAPNFLRVNGPIVNMDEFYEAFNIKPGDKMYRAPEKRVRIW